MQVQRSFGATLSSLKSFFDRLAADPPGPAQPAPAHPENAPAVPLQPAAKPRPDTKTAGKALKSLHCQSSSCCHSIICILLPSTMAAYE